ncbi:MAG: GNAT family N-acetyltransferase [Anaerolineae bacterium]
MKAPEICLKGERVTIRPLTRQDLRTMSKWPSFDDPLYRLFDWPMRSELSDDLWFYQLVRDKSRIYFAVDNEHGELIGRLSLRDIRRRTSARLGIGFGAQYVSQGYGTEALQLFLRYYFQDMHFERMVLDVAAVNARAVRCYERCGFKRVDEHYQYAGSDGDVAFLDQPAYEHLRHFFKRDRYRNTVLAYDMELRRKDWLAEQALAK